MTLRAIVVGTGWAGEGHSKALRGAGVEVVALCGRTPEPAKAMAQKLGIAEVRFDWQQAITTLQPDIVSIATPASLHHEIALVAAQLGCHILCEKPLALNAAQARAMLQAGVQAGVQPALGRPPHRPTKPNAVQFGPHATGTPVSLLAHSLGLIYKDASKS